MTLIKNFWWVIVINRKDNFKLTKSFNKIKSEITDHLESINENTNEINTNSMYLTQLENMIHKLSERIDEIEIKVSYVTGEKIISSDEFKDIILNAKEKEIFIMLYKENGDLLDYKKIARSLGYTEQSVRKYISDLISKGIPVIKKYFDNNVYLVLDSDFRNLQAKQNVLKLG